MPDPVTINRGYAVPSRGADPGTWDTPLNGDFNLIDQNLGAVTSISVAGGTTTLNAAQLACGTISLTGTLTADVLIVFPAVQGWWSIANFATVGAFAVFVACGSQATSIGIPPGEIIDVQINTNTPFYRNLGRIGSPMDLVTSTVPRWISASTVPPYLNCDGSTFSGATYPFLAAFLGGTTLPDFRGVARYTLNQGTSRLTTAGSGLDGNTLLAIKTTQSVGLITANLPPYTPSGTIAVSTNQGNPLDPIYAGIGGTNPFSGIGGNAYGGIPTTITASFTGAPQGGTSTAFGVVGPGTVAGITLIRAA